MKAAGVRTTYGSLVHAHNTPAANELCVARTLEAGGVLPLIDVIGRLASDASHALETKIHIDALDSFPFTGKDQLRLAQFQPETGRPFGTNQAVSLIEIVQAVPP